MDERRKYPRTNVSAIIDYLARKDYLICEMKDLSANGVFAVTSEPIPVGETIFLDFYLPGFVRKFKLKGRVVRTVSEDEASRDGLVPGMGIEFFDVSPKTQEDIIRFVSEGFEEDVRG